MRCREAGTILGMPSLAPEITAVLPIDLLQRFDVPGPRYTSYPTADRFVEAFGPADYTGALQQRASGAMVGGRKPLSLYVHIPFCESVCYYCACNKVITRHHERATEYLDVLEAEMDLHVLPLMQVAPAQGLTRQGRISRKPLSTSAVSAWLRTCARG